MKLTHIKTFVVGTPPPHEGGMYWVFVRLTTDSGIVGYGEAYSLPFHPHVVARMIEDLFERHALGKNPYHIERLWRDIYAQGYSSRADLSVMGVLSALEMACWDIIGKDVGKPVYELLGGQVHEALRSYTYLYPEPDDPTDVYTDPELGAERALAYQAMGFTALKFDPVGPYTAYDPRQLGLASLRLSETYVRSIREAVGDGCDLLFGTHGQMTADSAIRLARRLEPFDPLWLEEPVPPENVAEMAKVAHATSIPIATGERLASKYEFVDVLTHQAASILQMNLGRVGGLLEAKKIAGMAEAHYAQLAPHLYCGPIVGAANVHLATCSPNFLIQESIRDWGGFHTEILQEPMRWENGSIIPPKGPGLGVVLNEEVAEAHPYEGTLLHLNTHHRPLMG